MKLSLITLALAAFPSLALAQQPRQTPWMQQPSIDMPQVLHEVFQLGVNAGQIVVERDRIAEERLKWVLDNWVPKQEPKP